MLNVPSPDQSSQEGKEVQVIRGLLRIFSTPPQNTTRQPVTPGPPRCSGAVGEVPPQASEEEKGT